MHYFFKPRFFIVGTFLLSIAFGSVASASHLSQGEIDSVQAQILSALNTINDLEIQLAATGDVASLSSPAIACPSPRIISDLKSGSADAIIARNPIVRERGQVTALQEFLWQYKGRYSATYWNQLNQVTDKSDFVTGYYGSRTGNVVRAFQRELGVAYPNQSDPEYGKVLLKTRNMMALQCGALTEAQITAISSLLSSWGINTGMLSNVESALAGLPAQYVGGSTVTESQMSSIVALLNSFGARQSVIDNVRFALTGSGTPSIKSVTVENALGIPAQNITAGGSNQLIGAFDLTAVGEAINIPQFTLFLVTTGGATSTDFTNISLYDSSGIIVAGPKESVAGSVSFTDQFTVPVGTKRYLLKASVRSGIPNLSTVHYVTNPANNWSAVGQTSRQSIARLPNAFVSGTAMTVQSASFTVSEDRSAGLSYRIAQGGAAGVTLARLRFSATNEAINITQLALQLTNKASSSPADLVGNQVRLYKSDGVTQVGTITFPGNSMRASSTISNFQIPAYDFAVMIVKADLSQIGTFYAGTQGHLVSVDYLNDAGGGRASTRGVGLSSGLAIYSTSPSTYVAGVRMFSSVPTFADVTSSTALVSGADLYKFSVAASESKGSTGQDGVQLRKVTFSVATTTGLNLSGMQLFGPNGPVNTIGIKVVGGKIAILFDSTATDRLIPAGSSKTFALRANVVCASTSCSASMRLLGDFAFPTLPKGVFMSDASHVTDGSPSYALVSANLIWSPQATTTVNTQDNDWTNGYGLPITGTVATMTNNLPTRTFVADGAPPPPPPVGDVTAPITTVLIPVGNNAATTTKKSMLSLIGAMFTDKPGTGVATSTAYWKNLTNNATGVLAPSYGWLGGPVALAPGLNTIEVGARDNAGNLGTARFYATYQVGTSTAAIDSRIPGLASIINSLISLIDELTSALNR